MTALFLAFALEELRQVSFVGFPGWPSHAVAPLVCDSVVFLLTLALLSRFTTAVDLGVAHATKIAVLDTSTEQPPRTENLGVASDFKQLSQTQCSLRDSEEQYRLLVATIPEVVWKTDAKGNVIFVSPQVVHLLGYSADEFRRHGDSLWFDSVHPDDKERIVRSFKLLITKGKPYDIVCRARRRNGEWFWAHDRAVATTSSDGSRFATGIISDITERIAGEESEKRYRLLFENMLGGSAHCEMVLDSCGRPIDFVYLAVNDAFAKLTGLQNVVGKKFTDVIPGDKKSHQELLERYSRVVLTGKPESFEIEIKAMGMWFSVSAYGAGKGCFGATFDNITDRKESEQALRQAEEKYRSIFLGAAVGMFQSTLAGRYITVNPAMARMLNYDSPEDLVASITDISHQVYVDPKSREELIRLVKERGRVQNFECEVHRKDGGKIWVSTNVRAVSKDGVVVGYEGTNEDVTVHKIAEERIQFLAYYDALTGLPNRTLFQDRFGKALAGARRQKCRIALLFLDLDGFKVINDSLGHAVGDLLLQEVAERLKRWGRDQDTVARLGGDEFLIMLTQMNETAEVVVSAERLMAAMTPEFLIQGHSLHVSCSIGISMFPEHGADCETLLKNADAAMYRAKQRGRNNFLFFAEDMNGQAVERLSLETSLRLALSKNELFLVYQPQIHVATGRVTGLEALLRWQHPALGLVPPDKFIRIAENSGLIIPIGEWVLRTACRQAKKWQEEGHAIISVAVNVSAVQLRQQGFCELIRRVLRETGLSPQCLELELTESLLMTSVGVTLPVLTELRLMGVTLAIDDFGTGYSNFTSLRQFGVSKLKIDRSFIRDVATKPDEAAITSAIISMAKSLHLKVIAEGVENEAQMSFLRAHHCDEIQGYYFSKPLAVDDVPDKLRSNR